MNRIYKTQCSQGMEWRTNALHMFLPVVLSTPAPSHFMQYSQAQQEMSSRKSWATAVISMGYSNPTQEKKLNPSNRLD